MALRAWRVLVTLVALCFVGACQRSPSSAPRQAMPPQRTITFNKDVAPILFDHCASCHRPIEANPAAPPRRAPASAGVLCVAGAPFSVLDYESLRPHVAAIAAAVASHAMPPWLPEPGYGDFANSRRLSEAQIATIQAWVREGAAEGSPADAPRVPVWPSGWQLGAPDMVLKVSDAFHLERGGGDVFRNFVIPVSLPSTRYVRAIEFRADNPRVLHHANVALDPDRVSRQLDRADPAPGFATMADDEVQNVFGWSPGKQPTFEAADTGWPLEPGTDVVVQLHMIANAAPQVVQPEIGLFFTDVPPARTVIAVKLESKSIDIAAGDANYAIEDSYVLPADVEVMSVYPHAHRLAREMRGTATRPDGTVIPLLWIRQWDTRWQDQYRYRVPVELPRGTRLSMRITYDNSPANPVNAGQPPRRVQWGPKSTDEMGALWFELVPRHAEDAGVLTEDYFRRAAQADLAAAELQVRSTPGAPAAHNLLATRYLQAGRAADAQAQFEEALRLSPGDAEAHSNLGTLFQAQGRLADALVHLRTAVRLKPGDDRIRFNLGNGLFLAGRLADAEREFRVAIAANPDNADAHFNLAMLLGPQNRLAEAIAHLERVIEITPRHAEAHRNLSVAYDLQGRRDEALAEARAAVRLAPGSTPAQQQLARLLASPAIR
jgi:Flp pilus assembly protein TadD